MDKTDVKKQDRSWEKMDTNRAHQGDKEGGAEMRSHSTTTAGDLH